MATLATLKAKIADDISRSDLTTQIGEEITAAIEEHEGERFWFNETRAYTFSTVAGTADYTLAESAPIYDFLAVDWVQVMIGTRPVNLRRCDPEEIDWLIASQISQGQPYNWAYYGQKFRFYAIPNAVYTVRVAGHYKLSALADNSSSNAWTTEAYELIRAATKRRLYALVIKNPDQAAIEQTATDVALSKLRAKTADKIGTGMIRPTQF